VDVSQRLNDIDLGLTVLCAITPPGHEWSQYDIAEICDCSRSLIYQIERRAMRKLKAKLNGKRMRWI